ncbi:MAG: 50S ribosomal protein L10 [bacterium]
MASQKILEGKKVVVDEILEKIKNSESVVVFQYQGLTVSDLTELRKELHKIDSEIKVYKNTLLKRAADELGLNMADFLKGPNAILFGKDLLEPIKVVSEFANKNKNVEIRIGIISGSVADTETIKEYAEIPSREGLLTMLAGGMIQYVRDLAIGLDLYADQIEGNDK